MYRLEELENRRLLSIALPSIPARTFNVLNYGAVANGSTNNATAITSAINAAKAAGGGTVEFPAAALAYESGPINLASNINFQVDAGAELQALPFSSYPNATTSPSHFITAKNISNFEITGAGTIDGNGSAWWTAYNNGTITNRPRLINITGSNTILIQGLTLQNSPMFHIAFGTTNTVTINDITINTPPNSPNTDGIDPAGQHYLIENCSISTGDDNIAIKPQSVFCGDITVSDCYFGAGHGMSVGGETNDGLNGLTVNNCTFYGTTAGIRLKASRGNGALVQNCTYSNLTMTDVEYPININSYYSASVPSNPQDPAQTLNATTPIWQNITITNVTSGWDTTGGEYTNSYCGIIWGLPEAPVNTVTLSNVNITAKYGVDLDHVRNVSFDSQCHFTAASGGDEITQKGGGTPYDVTVVQSNWTDSDIGSPAVVGQSVYDADTGTWTNTVGGSGFGGTSDQFNFAYTNLWGDGTITTKLAAQGNSSSSAQAALMIRESTAVDAAFAAAVVSPGHGTLFEYRPSDGAAVQSVPIYSTVAPTWLRITRSGSNFSAYDSNDGLSWFFIYSGTVTMTNSAMGGFAGSSASSTASSAIVFQSTTFSPAAPTAAITPVSPNPTASPVANISIKFSQPITGFDLTDLSLTRDGFTVPLTNASLSSIDGSTTWTLGNLSSVTANPGNYLIQITATNSGIANASGEGLASGSTTSWAMNTLTPTGPARLVHDNLFVDYYLSGVYQYSFESTSVPQLFVNPGSNTITVDLSSGNLNLPVAVTGGTLNLIGISPSDLFVFNSSQFTRGSQSIAVSNLQSLGLSTGTYALDQDINGPGLQIGNGATVQMYQDQHIASLAFSGNGSVNIENQTLYLAETGSVADAAVFGLLQAAQAANWSGPGIVSNLASPSDATSVGYFDTGSQIAIRYSWLGDTNLDGVVNADDLSLIMLGQASHETDWYSGNFNYDSEIDADDWALLQKGTAYAANNVLPSAVPMMGSDWQWADADLLS